MLKITEITSVDRKLVEDIARLHKRAFPGFFLTQLGIPFLKTLYTGYIQNPDSGISVAQEDGRLVGFIAYSYDYPGFYKGLMRHNLAKFAVCSMGAAVRHPSFIGRLLGAFGKSDSVVKQERYVELASICVDPSAGGKGIGTALIDHLKAQVDFDVYSYINLETDADGNDAVNRFYRNNGFALARTFVTNEGRRMNEYRYKPGYEQ